MRVSTPNLDSIGSAIFAGLTNVNNRQTDRHTDRPRYSVCSNRPHLAVAAMRPNKLDTSHSMSPRPLWYKEHDKHRKYQTAAVTYLKFLIQVCREFVSPRNVHAYTKIFPTCESFPSVTVNFELQLTISPCIAPRHQHQRCCHQS